MRHTITTLAVALAALPTILRSAPLTETETNKQAVRRVYDEAVNAGRMEALSELIAPEFAGPDGTRGPAAFAANVTALRAGFPDIRVTIEHVVAEGDRVAVRWTWTGTHSGTFRGFAASGKAVHDTGLVLYTFARGRVVEAIIETDRLGVLQQIGVVPKELSAPRAKD
ncbi:MAG: ester cyclase [Vicinamibacteria bacterium]